MNLRKIVIRIALGLLASIVALASWLAFQWLPPRPKLVVSRETTWLLGPLAPDGTVDYEAAWRAEHSAGVTPENNAAPLLLAMLGDDLAQFSEAERAALPKDVPQFVDFDTWKYDDEKHRPGEPHHSMPGAEEALEALETESIDSPGAHLAERWIDAIAACIPEVERAVSREHFFAPREFWNPDFIWPLFEVGRALRASAALRFAKGDANAGLEHLRSGLRLARLQRSIGVHAHLIPAEAGEAVVWECALRLARRAGRVSAAAVRDLVADADPSDLDARLRTWTESSRVSMLRGLVLARPPSGSKPSFVESLFARTDPNRTTRRFNEWTDRIEAASCAGSWSERLERVGRIQQQLVEASAAATSLWSLRSRDALGDAAVDLIMKYLSRQDFEMLVPEMLQTERQMIELAALAYATETGHDPKTSDDLTPLVFTSPWRDRVAHSAVDFSRAADGTLVAHGPLIEVQQRFDEWQKKPVSERAH